MNYFSEPSLKFDKGIAFSEIAPFSIGDILGLSFRNKGNSYFF